MAVKGRHADIDRRSVSATTHQLGRPSTTSCSCNMQIQYQDSKMYYIRRYFSCFGQLQCWRRERLLIRFIGVVCVLFASCWTAFYLPFLSSSMADLLRITHSIPCKHVTAPVQQSHHKPTIVSPREIETIGNVQAHTSSFRCYGMSGLHCLRHLGHSLTKGVAKLRALSQLS